MGASDTVVWMTGRTSAPLVMKDFVPETSGSRKPKEEEVQQE